VLARQPSSSPTANLLYCSCMCLRMSCPFSAGALPACRQSCGPTSRHSPEMSAVMGQAPLSPRCKRRGCVPARVLHAAVSKEVGLFLAVRAVRPSAGCPLARREAAWLPRCGHPATGFVQPGSPGRRRRGARKTAIAITWIRAARTSTQGAAPAVSRVSSRINPNTAGAKA
jgi:hypothetical protein